MIMEMVDGEASAERAGLAKNHIVLCPDCAIYRDKLVKMTEIISSMKVEAPEYMETRIMAKIASQKRNSGFNFIPAFSTVVSAVVVIFAAFLIYNNKPAQVTVALAQPPAVKAVAEAKLPVAVKIAKVPVKHAVIIAASKPSAAVKNVIIAKAQEAVVPAVKAPSAAAASAPEIAYAPAMAPLTAPVAKAANVNTNSAPFTAAAPSNTMHAADADKITATPTVVITAVGYVADNLINVNRGECAKVRVQVAQQCEVKIIVYDKAARIVSVLLDQNEPAGTWESTWCGRNDGGSVVTGGVYPVYMQVGQSVAKGFIIVTK
jgi:hypothetical protein